MDQYVKTVDLYDKQWKALHKLEAIRLVVYLGLLPYSMIVGLILRPFWSRSFSEGLLAGLLALYLMPLVMAQIRLLRFPCPRCAKRFFTNAWFVVGSFDDDCAYCGLKKFANSENKSVPK